MRAKYLKPNIDSMGIILDDIFCTSPGIDPGGGGHDFDWGNGT